MYPHVYTFVGIPGGPELLVILLLAVLLFGADRLPKLARSSGQAMGEFRKGREAVEAEIRAAREEPSEHRERDSSRRANGSARGARHASREASLDVDADTPSVTGGETDRA